MYGADSGSRWSHKQLWPRGSLYVCRRSADFWPYQRQACFLFMYCLLPRHRLAVLANFPVSPNDTARQRFDTIANLHVCGEVCTCLYLQGACVPLSITTSPGACWARRLPYNIRSMLSACTSPSGGVHGTAATPGFARIACAAPGCTSATRPWASPRASYLPRQCVSRTLHRLELRDGVLSGPNPRSVRCLSFQANTLRGPSPTIRGRHNSCRCHT